MYVWSLLVIMMMGLTSCGDDDELQFSEEQLAYINKNKEYIWEKKTEKDEMGELTYIIHSGFISGYQNRYGDNLKPPTNVYHRMTA